MNRKDMIEELFRSLGAPVVSMERIEDDAMYLVDCGGGWVRTVFDSQFDLLSQSEALLPDTRKQIEEWCLAGGFVPISAPNPVGGEGLPPVDAPWAPWTVANPTRHVPPSSVSISTKNGIPIAAYKGSCVPRVGETVSMRSRTYTVTDVDWRIHDARPSVWVTVDAPLQHPPRGMFFSTLRAEAPELDP